MAAATAGGESEVMHGGRGSEHDLEERRSHSEGGGGGGGESGAGGPSHWMHKQGAVVKSWKQRFFVASPTMLTYFTNDVRGSQYLLQVNAGFDPPPLDHAAQGFLTLHQCTVWFGHPVAIEAAVDAVSHSTPLGYFEVLTPVRRLRIMAQTREDRSLWAEVLRRNRQHAERDLVQRLPVYDTERHVVLEGTLMMGIARAKPRERNVVATLFFVSVFRSFTENEAMYSFSLVNCAMEADAERKQFVFTPSGGAPVTLTALDADSFTRWREFFGRQLSNLAAMREPVVAVPSSASTSSPSSSSSPAGTSEASSVDGSGGDNNDDGDDDDDHHHRRYAPSARLLAQRRHSRSLSLVGTPEGAVGLDLTSDGTGQLSRMFSRSVIAVPHLSIDSLEQISSTAEQMQPARSPPRSPQPSSPTRSPERA